MSESATNEQATDITALHQALIDGLKAKGELKQELVEAAFRAVPRHYFLPGVPLERVYSDEAIATKFDDGRPISSSSQPAIMAIMLEQLDLQPGQRVLEIGAGTGYNAALIAHIVGEQGHVTTIELDEDTAEGARQHLISAGFPRVKVICGDGMAGYAADAPYDRIVLTVGGWDIPPVWLEQLAPDGFLLLPLSLNGPQLSIAFERRHDHLVSRSVRGCGFMRLRGHLAEPDLTLQLGPEPHLFLELVATGSNQLSWHPPTLYDWLTGPAQELSAGAIVTIAQIWSGLSLWLALHEPNRCYLHAHGETAVYVPYLLGSDTPTLWRATTGIIGEAGVALLLRPPEEEAAAGVEGSSTTPFILHVRHFGPDDTPAQRLRGHIRAWNEAGCPNADGIRIRAYPLEPSYTPAVGEHVLSKRWRQFVMDWPYSPDDEREV